MIGAIEARTPSRLRVVYDTPPVGFDDAVGYALRRADGAGTALAVALAWAVDTAAAELVLSGELLDGVAYALTAPEGLSAQVTWRAPTAPLEADEGAADPEADAYGVDIDWLAPGLAPGGDLPDVRGLDALRGDLARIGITNAGELFHRPTEGGGLPARVNGPDTSAVSLVIASVRRAWRADDRVADAAVAVTVGTDGAVTIRGNVATLPLPDDPIALTVRR